ncbi:Protein-lysine methyltransferase METTL21B [Porphyridium purpureum]|uniref:Protein-lysine methyltransferase METTL21B n=1 Tax=Porphyridium purpureum TaxID=35688 RepID=A0A5J4YUD1_PORPP|nr:Protein-lysine methyltransferase METTL21B [Porphyridium purpureum]|eukprot:POR8682..scf227_4
MGWAQVEKSSQERFYAKYTLKVGEHDLHFAQLGASDVGLSVWDGGIILAQHVIWMHENGFIDMRAKTVVELGSGTGIVGMVCALLGAKHSVMTDIPGQVLDLLQKNIDENQARLQVPYLGTAAPLDWFVPEQALAIKEKYPNIDYIIAGEITYREELVGPLLNTLEALCGLPSQDSGQANPAAASPVILMSHGVHRVTPLIHFFRHVTTTMQYHIQVRPKKELPREYRNNKTYVKHLTRLSNNQASVSGGDEGLVGHWEIPNASDKTTESLLTRLQHCMESKAHILQNIGALEWEMCEQSALLAGSFWSRAPSAGGQEGSVPRSTSHDHLRSLQTLPERVATLLQEFGQLEWETCEILALLEVPVRSHSEMFEKSHSLVEVPEVFEQLRIAAGASPTRPNAGEVSFAAFEPGESGSLQSACPLDVLLNKPASVHHPGHALSALKGVGSL